MKYVILICILISTISSLANTPPGSSNKSTLTIFTEPIHRKNKLNKEDHIKLKARDFEKHTGKKLTLKEKIAFKIIHHNLKKELVAGTKPSAKNKGKTALILGIIGLALVFVPYANIASIPLAIIAIVMGNEAKKIDPSDKKARTAVVLGWVVIGLLCLFLLVGIIYLVLLLTLLR